jgi:hypothetical protein
VIRSREVGMTLGFALKPGMKDEVIYCDNQWVLRFVAISRSWAIATHWT